MPRKILLIIPPSPLKDSPWFLREERHSSEAAIPLNPHMAPAILGMVREHIADVSIKVFDAMVMDITINELISEINNYNPDIIIAVMSAYYLNCTTERQLAELPYPTLGIICPFSADPREAIEMYKLKTKYFVYTDETEMAITDGVKEFFKKGYIEETRGIVIQKGDEIIYTGDREYSDMSSYPLPAYDLFPMDKYLAHQEVITIKRSQYRNMALINTMKGCPFKCDFCIAAYSKYKPRFKSAAIVFKEMEYLHKVFGFERYEFLDSEFAVNIKDRKKLCRLLADSGMKISFLIKNRIELIDAELLDLLKKAGCVEIMYGIETADPLLQKKSIFKNIDLDLARENIALTKKYGFKVALFMIVGLLGESRESLKKNSQFIVDTKPDRIVCGPLFPDVGSPMYYRLKSSGLLIEKDWSHYRGLKKLCFKHDVYNSMEDIGKAQLWMMCQYRIGFAMDKNITLKRRILYLMFFLFGYSYYIFWDIIHKSNATKNIKDHIKSFFPILSTNVFKEKGLL